MEKLFEKKGKKSLPIESQGKCRKVKWVAAEIKLWEFNFKSHLFFTENLWNLKIYLKSLLTALQNLRI